VEKKKEKGKGKPKKGEKGDVIKNCLEGAKSDPPPTSFGSYATVWAGSPLADGPSSLV